MMKRSSLLLLLAMLALVFAGPTACKSKAQKQQEQQEQRILGAWFIDHDATLAQLPEDQQQMAGAFMRMMKLGIIFNKDETLTMRVSMMGQQDEQEGRYKILESSENSLIIELSREEITDEEGEVIEEEPSKMILTFLDDDRISFKPAAEEGDDQEELDEETLVLKRVTLEELDQQLEGGEQPSLEQLGLDPSLLDGAQDLDDLDGLELEGADEGEEADEEDVDAEDADEDDVEDADADADAEDADEDDADEDAAE